ncbi:permease of ABC transporter [Bordetella pertussis]|nr:permease of ABC transporter [Bordetella pertussis]
MLAVVAVGIGTYVSHLLVERASARQRPARSGESS